MQSYFQSTEDYKHDNAAIALGGLYAPASYGVDTYAWALDTVERNEKKSQEALEKIPPGSWAGDNSPLLKAMEGSSDEIKKQSPYSDIEKETSGLNCLISQKQSDKPVLQSCDDKVKAAKLVAKYKLLIERYRKASTYHRYISLSMPASFPMSAVVEAQRLFLTDLVLKSSAQPDMAVQEWMDNAIYLQHMLSSESNFVGRAIFMMMYSMSQRALPVILKDHPQTVVKNKEALLKTLRPFGPAEMNVPLIFKGEYKIWLPVFSHLSQRNQLVFYEMAQKYVALSTEKPANLDNESIYKAMWRMNDLFHPYQSIITNLLVNGIFKAKGLITTMYGLGARNDVLNLYVRMKAQGISPRDANKAFAMNKDEAERQRQFGEWARAHDMVFNISYSGSREQVSYGADDNAIHYYNPDTDMRFEIAY